MELIAEFCQNHNGDFEILRDMVFAAQEAGCTYGKIQSISPDMVTYRQRFEDGLVENGEVKVVKRPYQAEFERMQKLELTLDQQADFVELCKKVGLKPLTTAFSRHSVPKLKELGFDHIKIASYDCASVPLLRDSVAIFDRVIVSTGATFDHEIDQAACALSGSDFTFLHCVTMYPTPIQEYHLARMNYLAKYTNSVGWSDHSNVAVDGINGTLAAIYFGAKVIERHFTILEPNETKDGPVSINQHHASELVAASLLPKEELCSYLHECFPDYQKTWGRLERSLTEQELLNRDYFRGRFASPLGNGKHMYNWQ